MTVRCEIAEPHCETSAQSREDLMRTREVRGGSEGRVRWPKARRSRSVHESCGLSAHPFQPSQEKKEEETGARSCERTCHIAARAVPAIV